MANTRSAYGSVLGTITSIAGVLTNTFDGIDSGVGMATTAINDAARRQQARSKLDAHAYKKTISTEKSMELLLQQEEVLDWCSQSEGRTARFTETYDELLAILD